jgi:vancomycin permeability regulator SanA
MPEAGRRAAPRGRRRWAGWLLGIALASVAFVVAANLYLIARASAATLPGVEPAPVRPYAIVLGNRVFPDGKPSRELANRLEAALALHRAGRAGKVIVSGRVGEGYDEPHAMAAWLQARGVPPADIVVDEGGHRTAATMADAAALGVRSAHVVTQGYHLPRALLFARHAGIDALGVPAPAWRPGWSNWLQVLVRESLARAEALLEVTFRGVR